MEGSELVVCRRNELHEVLLHHIRVLAGHCFLKTSVDNALIRHFLLQIVVDELRIILCADAGERLSLRLRNAKLFKSILDLLRNVVPAALHIGLGADVVGDFVHIKAFNGRTPVRDIHLVVQIKAVQTEVMHPLGIVLLTGDLFNNISCQALLHAVEALGLIVLEIIEASVHFLNIKICHVITSYCSMKRSKPFSLISSTSSGPPV